MKTSDKNIIQVAGMLLFIGAVQFIIGMNLAEFLYPGYNVSRNYISDLGATCRTTCVTYQPSAYIFDTSIIILGILILIGSYFIWRSDKYLTVLLSLTGIGAIGAGLFSETNMIIHITAASMAFFFGALSAIAGYRLVRAPFNYLSILLGLMGMIFIVLWYSGIFLGLGVGGMERMIAYPILLWMTGFGGYLTGMQE